MPSARTKRYRARVERRYGQRALNSKQESGQDGTPKPDPDGAFSDNAPIDDISFNMEAEESVDDVSHETSTFRESSASPSENTEYKGRKRTVHHRAHHSRAQTKRRCVKYTERQLNVLWPPSEREPIETLYHWKILCSPQERAERAPYCFRPSDGQPRAYFERLFKAFEARRLAAAQQQNSSSGTPPSTTSHEHALTPAFPLLLTARSEGLEGSRPRLSSPNNIPVQFPRWKGKGAQPSDNSSRIRVLEDRCQFLEVAMQQCLNEVAERQDCAVDARIQRAIEPLREEQDRLNRVVAPLATRMDDITQTLMRDLSEIKEALMLKNPRHRRFCTPDGSPGHP